MKLSSSINEKLMICAYLFELAWSLTVPNKYSSTVPIEKYLVVTTY